MHPLSAILPTNPGLLGPGISRIHSIIGGSGYQPRCDVQGRGSSVTFNIVTVHHHHIHHNHLPGHENNISLSHSLTCQSQSDPLQSTLEDSTAANLLSTRCPLPEAPLYTVPSQQQYSDQPTNHQGQSFVQQKPDDGCLAAPLVTY